MAPWSRGPLIEERTTRGRRGRASQRVHRRVLPKSAVAPVAPHPKIAAAPVAPTLLTRAERRRIRRRHRRMIVVGAVVVLLIAAVAVTVVVRRSSSTSAKRATREPAVVPVSAVTPTFLFAHRDANDRLDLVALVENGKRGGSVVLVPTATQIEVPALGTQTVADLSRLGDDAVLQTGVENALGVRVGQVLVLNDLGLVGALKPAGELIVRFRQPVEPSEGAPRQILAAGRQTISSDDAAIVLAHPDRTKELDHLVAVQAIFEGWIAALHNPDVARQTQDRVPQLQPFVKLGEAGETRVDTVPVQAIGGGGETRFQIREADLGAMLAATMPSARLAGSGHRPRVEVLNGVGSVGVSQKVAACLVPAGAHVTLTGNVRGFGVPTTQVRYATESDAQVAQEYATLLGAGIVGRSKALDVVDVSVVVGADFAQCKS